MDSQYEIVIGLEVHVELKTESKIFCACPTTFGAEPNTQCCPICMGFPGTLPVLNEKVVEYAVKAGLSTNCDITRLGRQDRKNYFYPDLPKAYQISQFDLPLCKEGFVDITIGDKDKRIGITRIHIEEDAGKLIHDLSGGTLIDYNRCGVPLIEIVSEPDMRSAEEAVAYLKKLRSILLYTGISDCRMNEGSLRCDVNLSVMKKGAEAYGTRTEMKNLNSFAFIKNAIEHEAKRQIKAVEAGETIVQETRRWDQGKGESISMRTKEDAHDYRYFPDPDLAGIEISEAYLEDLQAAMPILPDQRKKAYMDHYGLTADAAEQMTASKALADYFESCCGSVSSPSQLANLMMTDVFKGSMDEEDASASFIPPKDIIRLMEGLESGQMNMSLVKKALSYILTEGGTADEIIFRYDLQMLRDKDQLMALSRQILSEKPGIMKDYLSGKEKAMGAFMGQMMKLSAGKADPELSEVLFKALAEEATASQKN